MTEMLLCRVLTSLPRCRQRGGQRPCTQVAPLGQASASRLQPLTSGINRRTCTRKKNGCEPLCCLSRRCPDQGRGHSRSRDYWHVLRLSDSADGLPPPPALNNAFCCIPLHSGVNIKPNQSNFFPLEALTARVAIINSFPR